MVESPLCQKLRQWTEEAKREAAEERPKMDSSDRGDTRRTKSDGHLVTQVVVARCFTQLKLICISLAGEIVTNLWDSSS